MFSYKKYFKLRRKFFHTKGLLSNYYLFRISRIEAKNGCFFATGRLKRDVFEDNLPILPHGLMGIVISGESYIGKNCTIFQQVNVIISKGKAPVIGDNVVLGAGCIIVGGVKIGNNVKIGAGCVVACDIPNHATVVMQKPRIIVKDN
jgi:serine O-acetyltransferase